MKYCLLAAGLLFLLCASGLACSDGSPEDCRLTLAGSASEAGGEATIEISVSEPFGKIVLTIEFDRSLIETGSELLKPADGYTVTEENGYICIEPDGPPAAGKTTELKFVIKPGVPEGQYSIRAEILYSEDLDGNPVRIDSRGAMFHVLGKLGDLDGDGKTNSKDSLLLRKYLARNQVDTGRLLFFDTDGDGKTNSKDSLLLRKYLARNEVAFRIHGDRDICIGTADNPVFSGANSSMRAFVYSETEKTSYEHTVTDPLIIPGDEYSLSLSASGVPDETGLYSGGAGISGKTVLGTYSGTVSVTFPGTSFAGGIITTPSGDSYDFKVSCSGCSYAAVLSEPLVLNFVLNEEKASAAVSFETGMYKAVVNAGGIPPETRITINGGPFRSPALCGKNIEIFFSGEYESFDFGIGSVYSYEGKDYLLIANGDIASCNFSEEKDGLRFTAELTSGTSYIIFESKELRGPPAASAAQNIGDIISYETVITMNVMGYSHKEKGTLKAEVVSVGSRTYTVEVKSSSAFMSSGRYELPLDEPVSDAVFSDSLLRLPVSGTAAIGGEECYESSVYSCGTVLHVYAGTDDGVIRKLTMDGETEVSGMSVPVSAVITLVR